jgi:hydroxypyruvate isomerase
VLVEPVSGAPRYPLRTAADAVAVIDRVAAATGVANLGLLCDLYHLASNADDRPYGLIEATARRDDAPDPGPAFDPGQGW